MSANDSRVWLRRARSNLERARLGRASEEILYEDLCFDAQQAAEKALKAVLVHLGVSVPKTHSIGYLLDLIERSQRIHVLKSVRDAMVLTDYAVSTRYPGGLGAGR